MSSVQGKVEPSGFALLKKWGQHSVIVTILLVLLGVIVAGTSENIHAQMLKLGAYLWDDYFVLRGERPDASCDPNPNIESRLDELEREHEQDNADFDLFATEFDRETARESLMGQMRVCQKKHDNLRIYDASFTPSVAVFRILEHTFADIALYAIAKQKLSLILLLVLSAIIATAQNQTISFRGVKTALDHYVCHLTQGLTYLCLAISTYTYYVGSMNSGTEVMNPEVLIILMVGCGILVAICLYHVFQKGDIIQPGKGSILRALLTVPIHTYMLMAGVFHFFVNENHLPGIAIYFTQIFQLTNLHLAVGLYVLAGMLLKETLIGAKMFDIFRPWKLPPEMLAFVAILLLAYPTAYTGASGIIIIAVGAVVYQEMRRVGTRRQLALAVTALTGSGVVLRPCLLVVGVAILNKEVVTDELFHWGFRVFLLSMVVFAFYAIITRRDPMHITPFREALPPSLRLMKPMIPYVLILFFCLLFYGLVLDTYLDEFSAPIVLPVIMMIVIVFERLYSKDFHGRNETAGAAPTVSKAFTTAVQNSGVQIGALLMLMACSFTVGGIIERGESALQIPEFFDNPYLAMAFLLVFLVGIGMVMDPFGALILVTGTIAPIAYANGINPIHFWMTALMAFELGYVSPPVALNHLLARQVVGDEEVDLAHEQEKNSSFYYRHERYLLPLLVQGTTLALVAFGPLMFMD